MTMIAPAPLIGEISKDLRVSLGAAVAMTMMVVMLTTSIVAFLSGFLIDRLGFATVWIAGCVMQVVGALAIGPLSHSVSGLIIGRVLMGMGMGPINAVIAKDSGILLILLPCAMLLFSSIVNPTIYGYIANHFPSAVSGRLGGTATSLAGLGSLAGMAVGSTALAVTGGYTVSMNVLAVVIVIAGLASIFIRSPA
jgi:MFS family permease